MEISVKTRLNSLSGTALCVGMSFTWTLLGEQNTIEEVVKGMLGMTWQNLDLTSYIFIFCFGFCLDLVFVLFLTEQA